MISSNRKGSLKPVQYMGKALGLILQTLFSIATGQHVGLSLDHGRDPLMTAIKLYESNLTTQKPFLEELPQTAR
jgi:hypothetical protein